MSARDFDASFIAAALPVFISEAREQIESIEQLLLALEEQPADRALLDNLFRCAHTVKGSAGIFGLDAVVAFTHHVETLLDLLREGRLAFGPALGTLLLACNDQMRHLVASAENGEAQAADQALDCQALVQRLQLASGQAAGDSALEPVAGPPALPTARPVRTWRVTVRFGPDTFRNGTDPLTLLNYLRGLGTMSGLRPHGPPVPPLHELQPEQCHCGYAFDLAGDIGIDDIEGAFSFVRDDCDLQIEAPEAPAAPGGTAAAPAATATVPAQASSEAGPVAGAVARPPVADDTRYIRVQADRLDAVIDLLGELVIASAGAELQASHAQLPALIEATQEIGRLVEGIRNGTLQLRMVPIGETFARFRRVVRDTAGELGKDVQLEIEGGDTELDKSVVERIADPLMHLVRNALDHGLEPPAERLAAGKPARGALRLKACHEAGGIAIRIQDDGRGIQRGKVLVRARQRGLIDEAATPTDAELCRLVFAPGFSTAEQVTNLSGRGVGMDVVKQNIEALRGSVLIDSVEGQGSTIEIRLPLTLAIIDGFGVGVGRSKFIFPLDTVVEVIEGRAAACQIDAQGRGCVELRGQVLPVVGMRGIYGLAGDEPPRASIVVLRGADGRCFGARVDELLGQHQTVIKPLPRMFRSLPGMAGSSILGSGEVALIIDVARFGRFAAERPRAVAHGGSAP